MRPLALLTLLFLPAALAPAPAPADGLSVLTDAPGEPPVSKRLYAFLQSRAKTHFDARREAVAALRTPEDVSRRQELLKALFRTMLGELPTARTPLNARVVGRDRRDGYAVERVIYESRPGHHVTANLYLPDAPPPFPGVLVPCGHSANGKAAETYQRACVLLARNGLAALCYDPIGQGERVQWLDPAGKPALSGSTTEHTLAGIGALLVGRSAAGYRFWDGVRSLDYLASRPEVDPARIGCTGNSGGGTMTAYLMALDDRVAAAAPSCYVTSLERLFATIGPQDAEQNLTGQVALGLEHADFLTMRAPRPTLLSVGTRDYFDIRGARDTYREAQGVYQTLGQADRVALFESDEPHGFTRPRREACVRWMRRWLLGKDDLTPETDSPVAADKDLQCTRTGQVLRDFPGSRSVFALNAERAGALERRRTDRAAGVSAAELRTRLALPPKPGSVIVGERPGTIRRDGYTVDRWPIVTEPGVTVPLLLFRPNDPVGGKPMTVYVGADRALAAPGGPIEARVKAGESIALIEPRGTGEGAPAGSGPFGADEKEAFLALHLNRPLISQRVFDVLQALRALEPAEGKADVHLVGVGPLATVALHAAALNPGVTHLTLERPVLSWTAVASTPSQRGNLADVIPGALLSYDLPDLAASLAPRGLTVRSPVDPTGKAVSQSTLDATYAACKRAYRAASAGDKLRLDAAP